MKRVCCIGSGEWRVDRLANNALTPAPQHTDTHTHTHTYGSKSLFPCARFVLVENVTAARCTPSVCACQPWCEVNSAACAVPACCACAGCPLGLKSGPPLPPCRPSSSPRDVVLRCQHPTWYALDLYHGCAPGAGQRRVGFTRARGTFQDCLQTCEEERAALGCVAIDFFPESRSCVRYSRVCHETTTSGASSAVLGCRDPCEGGVNVYTGDPCTPRMETWARNFARREDALLRVQAARNGSIGRQQRARLSRWIKQNVTKRLTWGWHIWDNLMGKLEKLKGDPIVRLRGKPQSGQQH